ncbi:transcriptional regulator with XRE-family HTH domain/TPR repeat protein [Actinoalloteichus hoggarensis]|nr:transcriptional regulator with XRE-family HTH domain/TPR repeat protein [Actinoalloteichus hoggarensis]
MLAGLVGRSEDWLSKIERGDREIRRVDVLVDLAKALRVMLGDLLGEPVFLEDGAQNDDVPAVRDALMTPRRLSAKLFASTRSDTTEPLDPQTVARWAESAFFEYQNGGLGRVIAVLPRLINTAQQLDSARSELCQQRAGAAVSARIHHLATTALSKLGEVDLAWIAAERAMQAADRADDPLVLASAARAGTHALLAVGRFGDAVELGETAARWLRPQMHTNDPAALSLLGMLYLRTAVAAARRQDRSAAEELLRKAQRAGDAVGTDANHWQTGFGPTNVALHRVSAALDLGDMAAAVTQARRISATHLPVERQVTHLIDLSRALSATASEDEALQVLLTAEQKSAQMVRNSVLVRGVVRTLYRRSTSAGRRSSSLIALALRCHAIGGN